MDPYAELRRGDIDVLVNYLVVSEPDLTGGPVIDYRDRLFAGARGHRLAARESVCVEDLGDEEAHDIPPTFPAELYDAIAPPVTPSGRPIRRTYPWRSHEGVLTAVARGAHRAPADEPGPADHSLRLRADPDQESASDGSPSRQERSAGQQAGSSAAFKGLPIAWDTCAGAS